MPDTKDFRTIDEQIEGLEKRGLQFKNKKKHRCTRGTNKIK